MKERTIADLRGAIKCFPKEELDGMLKMVNMINFDFASSTNHYYALGDVILCKLNLLSKRQLQKNPYYVNHAVHCELCDRGFPLNYQGYHMPTQSLGMIPLTKCDKRK
jgi:hypothetical protein